MWLSVVMGGEGASGPLGGKALEESGRWYHTSASTSDRALSALADTGRSASWDQLLPQTEPQ